MKSCTSQFTVKLLVNEFEKLSLQVLELWRHIKLLTVVRDQQTAVSQKKWRDILWSEGGDIMITVRHRTPESQGAKTS